MLLKDIGLINDSLCDIALTLRLNFRQYLTDDSSSWMSYIFFKFNLLLNS